ncbi:hypothetical protein Hdeb2414_s0015g00438461 [Helianthus debilis subsp. tardiflorus]
MCVSKLCHLRDVDHHKLVSYREEALKMGNCAGMDIGFGVSAAAMAIGLIYLLCGTPLYRNKLTSGTLAFPRLHFPKFPWRFLWLHQFGREQRRTTNDCRCHVRFFDMLQTQEISLNGDQRTSDTSTDRSVVGFGNDNGTQHYSIDGITDVTSLSLLF